MTIIDKLERADGPDREIDAMIHFHVTAGIGCGMAQDAPHYTSSIDAAMTLVPEEYVWSVNTFAEPSRASAYLVRHDNCYVKTGNQFCATPALALCIAALRARSQGGE